MCRGLLAVPSSLGCKCSAQQASLPPFLPFFALNQSTVSGGHGAPAKCLATLCAPFPCSHQRLSPWGNRSFLFSYPWDFPGLFQVQTLLYCTHKLSRHPYQFNVFVSKLHFLHGRFLPEAAQQSCELLCQNLGVGNVYCRGQLSSNPLQSNRTGTASCP